METKILVHEVLRRVDEIRGEVSRENVKGSQTLRKAHGYEGRAIKEIPGVEQVKARRHGENGKYRRWKDKTWDDEKKMTAADGKAKKKECEKFGSK